MQRHENEGCRPINPDETIAHLGGRGLSGALVYTGTRKVTRTETRLRLYVNGKRGWTYYIAVTVSGVDLYDIEAWGIRGVTKRLLGETGALFFDELQAAVEALYDRVMNETNGGWIPLS